MTKRQKTLISILVVGAFGSIVALGAFGLFSSTTQNAGNELGAGTDTIGDNDSGSALFNVFGAKPGDSWTKCIKITYTGSLPADVHLYLNNTTGPLAQYLNMTIIQGAQSSSTFPDCTGFTPDATGTIFEGPAMSPTPGSYEAGLPIVPAGQTLWNSGDSLVMKLVMTLDPSAPDTVQGASTGNSTIVWEAHNH
jgi:hypothetical protein